MTHTLHRVAACAGALLLAGCASTFDLQAHRGGRGLLPENTLPAFANAISLGVTTLELDTDITSDGVVVIGHDPSLNPNIVRRPDGTWLEEKGPAIHSLTFAALSQYDIGRLKPGTAYAKTFAEQRAIDGTRYARLTDLFDMVRRSGNTAVRFNVETKVSPLEPEETLAPEPFTLRLLEVIRGSGMASRVTIQSFDWRTLQVVQRVAPEFTTVYLTAQQRFLDNIAADQPEGSPWTAGFRYRDYRSVAKMVKAAGGSVWSPYFGDVDAGKVAEAHALGLKVVVWTVNNRDQMKKLLEMQVDGIITDRPDVLREVLAQHGIALPRPTPFRYPGAG